MHPLLFSLSFICSTCDLYRGFTVSTQQEETEAGVLKSNKAIFGMCTRQLLNFVPTFVLLTATQPRCYVCCSSSRPLCLFVWGLRCVSLTFWCQCTLNTRLNTYSSKTSKRCAASQIHYGSDVPTGLVEHPMERTANGQHTTSRTFPLFPNPCSEWNKWREID